MILVVANILKVKVVTMAGDIATQGKDEIKPKVASDAETGGNGKRREESSEEEEKERVSVMPPWLDWFDLWDSWHFGEWREMTEEAGREWRVGGRCSRESLDRVSYG